MPIPRKRRLFLEQLESRIALSSYFVSPTGNDNNAGTSMAPWLTLQHAADHLVAGDNVTVETGTYAGFSMGWNFAQNGTAAAPIIWNAQPGVVINAKNPMWTPEYETHARSLSSQSEYRVLEGVGHWIMLEKPAEFNAALLEMLGRFDLIAK